MTAAAVRIGVLTPHYTPGPDALRALGVHRLALIGAPWFEPSFNELGAVVPIRAKLLDRIIGSGEHRYVELCTPIVNRPAQRCSRRWAGRL